ncbi:PDZ domain-containing protein [Tumidithrix helvetica PCC 7403]|uniref:PDZ domain-containing protein n=1 Tax=Tumidithrix helvetica TaxID=3457545 RepID=UPI003C8B2E37
MPEENTPKEKDEQQSYIGIDHMNGGEIHAGAKVAGVIYEGDTTTSAEQRAKDALSVIKDELQGDFLNISLIVKAIEDNPPRPFWDIRRANETELAYQDRARSYFQYYINTVNLQLRELKLSTSVYESFKRDLAHYSNLMLRIKKTHESLDEVRDSLARLEGGLSHLIQLNLSDLERVAQSDSLHREKITNAKLNLTASAAHFCLVITEEVDAEILSESLEGAGVNLILRQGNEGWREARKVVSKLSQEKVNILKKRVKVVDEANQREVERRIKDPYIRILREVSGLPLELSEAELFSLRNKEVNQNECDPKQLFKLAAFSFLESDGHDSIFYFEKVLSNGSLSPILQRFAQLSAERLKHPDIYADSLGIMVIKLLSSGSFERGGLQEGDVIFALDGKTINEPGEIASALGKSDDSPVLLDVIRDGKPLKKVIQGGDSAGVILSQLVVLNTIQL